MPKTTKTPKTPNKKPLYIYYSQKPEKHILSAQAAKLKSYYPHLSNKDAYFLCQTAADLFNSANKFISPIVSTLSKPPHIPINGFQEHSALYSTFRSIINSLLNSLCKYKPFFNLHKKQVQSLSRPAYAHLLFHNYVLLEFWASYHLADTIENHLASHLPKLTLPHKQKNITSPSSPSPRAHAHTRTRIKLT